MKHRLSAIVFFFAFFTAGSAFASIPSINTSSGKYAALVMDADTGEVFFSRNADKKRYPASLTKMMTLYMLFEALKSGDVTMNTRMGVSKHAASQPQTNISLKTGQTIKVEDAIEALVVRSANDVAAVVAEHLGETEWNFAKKMTAKARSLGMRNTQFRNAHGLPDVQQYTTARDMAKLSIALRRDFPQYYHYFKTKSFTWKGHTYTSHNRVLDRFDGVDGIKTGYINMSGFNLASSVKRDGYHIVAVVMGGQSGQIRDNHMVSLLNNAFTEIAERADEPRMFAKAPTPKPKPETNLAQANAPLPWQRPTNTPAAQAPLPVEKPVQLASANPVAAQELAANAAPDASPIALEAPKPAPAPESRRSFFRFVTEPSKKQLREQNTLDFQLASLDPSPVIREKWGIQVGAFRDEEAAKDAATKALQKAGNYLKNSQLNITDAGTRQASIHRARLANLTESQAKRACKTLSRQNTPCFVFRFDASQNL